MTRLVAISDMHGQLPAPVELPEGDVLVIGGDICPDFGRRMSYLGGFGMLLQADWLDKTFRQWLIDVSPRFDAIIGIAGNHDFVFQRDDLLPEDLHWTYLKDTGVVIDGLHFWGTPWVPNLPMWAFCANEKALKLRAAIIPEDTDVLISHGPPFGYLDRVPRGGHVGDGALLSRLRAIEPLALVCGHIHNQRGSAALPGTSTRMYDVSLLDDRYARVNEPTIIDV